LCRCAEREQNGREIDWYSVHDCRSRESVLAVTFEADEETDVRRVPGAIGRLRGSCAYDRVTDQTRGTGSRVIMTSMR
jgi:hypothetical protein